MITANHLRLRGEQRSILLATLDCEIRDRQSTRLQIDEAWLILIANNYDDNYFALN